jgi:hypothetical protein
MKLNLYKTPEKAAVHVYAHSLQAAPNTIAMITCFLSGMTIQQTSSALDIPYASVGQARYRFRELISAYLKQGSIYLPSYY